MRLCCLSLCSAVTNTILLGAVSLSRNDLRDQSLIFMCIFSGDTLGSIVYVPCEVMKQRMQVQGTRKYWSSVVMKDGARANHGVHMYGYYSGMFQAGCSIWKEQGLKGLYAGYVLAVKLFRDLVIHIPRFLFY